MATQGIHSGIGGETGKGPPGTYPALFGLQVLLVEDELLVAMMLEDMLAEFGCIVTGSAATVARALAEIKASDSIDAAILDVNLGGEKIFPVADVLMEMDVPVVFSTAYGPAGLAERYPRSRLLTKPYAPEALAQVLMDISRRQLH